MPDDTLKTMPLTPVQTIQTHELVQELLNRSQVAVLLLVPLTSPQLHVSMTGRALEIHGLLAEANIVIRRNLREGHP